MMKAGLRFNKQLQICYDIKVELKNSCKRLFMQRFMQGKIAMLND